MSAWPYFLGMAGAAITAGAVAVPAARNLFLGEVEIDWLGNELELDRIGVDGMTVHTKEGTRFRVFEIEGRSYEAKPVRLQKALLAGREAWLNRLGEMGVAVRLFGVKRRRGTVHGAEWPSPALAEIGAEEAKAFRHAYEICWFAVISARARSGSRVLAEAADHTLSALAEYRPEPVRRHDAGGPEGGCPLSGFLNLLVCGDLRRDLAEVSSNVSANLQASDLIFERNGSAFARQLMPAHYRTICVSAWAEEVSGETAAELLALPGEIKVSQAAIPQSRDTTVALLARKKRELHFNIFGGGAAESEYAAAMELITDNKHTLFATQFTVIVRAPTAEEADELAARAGKPSNPWGEGPVRLFRTGAGQSHAFQFHVYDRPQANGHYLVFAPTGAGKTTLMMHLLGGLAKFEGVRSYVFDSKEGARFTIEALGGQYQSFENLRLNPLDVGGDSPANRQRVAAVMNAMLGDAAVTEEADTAVKHALDVMFKVDVPERTFNNVFPMAFKRRGQARASFARWVKDAKGNRGQYSHVFNAGRDSLGGVLGGSYLTGINMNEILSDAALAAPAVAHIGAAVSKSAAKASKGFNIFIDEAAALLLNPGFRDLAQEMFREYRKLDGAVGMAFQDPGALLASGVAEAVIENAATLIFFPNALATEKSLEPFRLNQEQMEFILRGAAGGGRRVMAVKREAATGFDESVILDVDLAPLGNIARFYRSGLAAVAWMDRLKRNHGNEWPKHV